MKAIKVTDKTTHPVLEFNLSGEFLIPEIKIIAKDSKTIFLKKVCQFERWIASPKQPQSDTGFVRASMKVRGVKNNINRKTSQIPVLCLIPVRTDRPPVNSAVQRRIASGRLNLSRKPRLKA